MTAVPKLAGTTLRAPKGVGKGYSIAYGADGKAVAFVKTRAGSGYGVRYDASGNPSIFSRTAAAPAAASPSAPASTQGSGGAGGNYPLSPDATSIAEGSAQNNVLGRSLRSIVGSEDASSSDYGLSLTRQPDQVLPDGSVVKGRVTGYDPNSFDNALVNNPFSRAAALQKSYHDAQNSTNVGFAARGHLYSGGRVAAQQGNDYGFESGKNALFSAFNNIIHGFGDARDTAQNSWDTADATTTGNLAARRAAVPVTGSSALDGQVGNPDIQAVSPGSPKLAAGWSIKYDNGKPIGFVNSATGQIVTDANKATAAPSSPKLLPGKDSKGNVGVWHIYPDGRKVFVKS